MGEGWLSLGLSDLVHEGFAKRPAKEVSESDNPIDFGSDLTQDLISLTREYTPREIAAMRSEARTGTPRRLYALFDEMLRFGPGPQIRKVRRGMKSATFRIQAPEPLREAQAAKTAEGKRAAEIAAYLAAQFLPFMSVIANAGATREIYGIGAVALKWQPGGYAGGKDLLVAAKEIPPRHFALDRTTKEWVFLPDPQVPTGAIPLKGLIETSALLFLEDGPGSKPLDQRGICFEILVPWCMSQFGSRWFSKWIELCGIPWRKIEFPKGDPKAQKQAEDIGKRSAAGGWAAYPSGMKLEFESAITSNGGSASPHERYLEFAERCYDKVCHGHSQASAVNAGDGSVQSSAKATDEATALDTSRLVDLAQDMRGFAFPIVARNFSPEDASRYAPEHAYAPPVKVDRKLEGEILVAAKTSGAAAGIKLVDAVEKLGYTLAEPGERTLADAAPEPVAEPGEPKGKPEEKLAKVYPFEAARGSGTPPDVATPAGVAEEMLAPYRDIFQAGIAEGESPQTALIRVMQRSRSGEPEADHVTNMLASALLGGTMRGIVSAREART